MISFWSNWLIAQNASGEGLATVISECEIGSYHE